MKKQERDARLQQRLAAVGEMAAGIAHEINTPMQYIGDSIYFLQEAFEDQRRLIDVAEDIARQLAARPDTAPMATALHDVAERIELDADFSGRQFTRIDQTIAMGALFTAHHLGCKAIVALTESGSTALWMSRHLIHIPIYAVTTKVASQRKMALYRNVRPLLN